MLLSQLIGRDIELVQSGYSKRYWRWKLHDSFIVDDKRGKFNWYKENIWGDYRDWLIYYRHLSSSEALVLSKETEVSYVSPPEVQLSANKITRYGRAIHSRPAQLYLANRLITGSTADLFRLGYTSNRICIPNFSPDGELVSARYRFIKPWIDGLGKEIRYISEPGSKPWFPYATWLLPREGGDLLFLCEGEFKVMCVWQMGYFAIGTQGTMFRPSWVEFLKNWNRVVYLRDSGELPGLKSAVAIKTMYSPLEVVSTFPYKAIDDYYRSEQESALEFMRKVSNEPFGRNLAIQSPEILG